MKSVIKDITREVHPRDDGSKPVVVYDIDYIHDSGELHFNQRYAFTMEQLPLPDNYFDRQAHALQLDLDVPVQRAVEVAAQAEIFKPVDDIVSQLRKQHKLEVGDTIPINDIKR